MSWCITGSCLKHRVRVFLQGWGPDAGRWCHLNGWPCLDLPRADNKYSVKLDRDSE